MTDFANVVYVDLIKSPIALVFGDGTCVFLRQSEKGNIALRRPA